MLLALEAPRAAQEFAARFAASPALRKAPKGDGHPVLVLPGLGGSDGYTRVLRAFLRRLDYHVHAWRLGRNWGPTDRIIDGLGERFVSLYEQHGRRLSLIGHSLGGVYARELARRAPEVVRQVITLGSPVRFSRGVGSNAAPVYRMLSSLHSERAKGEIPPGDHTPGAVPLTAIFTRTDGVVHWRGCVVEPGDHAECIEVRGSHSGLAHNPAALLVVANRLAQPEGEWRPFTGRRSARVWTPDRPA
jgi:pimeloyl-ACP methyl ester carboxylesterase